MPKEIDDLAARYKDRYPELARSLERASKKAIELGVPEKYPLPPLLSKETQRLVQLYEGEGYVIYNSLPTTTSLNK